MSTRLRLGGEEVRHGSETGNHDIGVAAALVTAVKDMAASCVGAMLRGLLLPGPRIPCEEQHKRVE